MLARHKRSHRKPLWDTWDYCQCLEIGPWSDNIERSQLFKNQVHHHHYSLWARDTTGALVTRDGDDCQDDSKQPPVCDKCWPILPLNIKQQFISCQLISFLLFQTAERQMQELLFGTSAPQKSSTSASSGLSNTSSAVKKPQAVREDSKMDWEFE